MNEDKPSTLHYLALAAALFLLTVLNWTGGFSAIALFFLIIALIYLSILTCAPAIVKLAVEMAPMDVDPVIYQINLHQITECGLHFSILAQIPTTQFPFDFFNIKVDIPSVRIKDPFHEVIADIHFSEPFIGNAKSNVTISQNIHVDFDDNLEAMQVNIMKINSSKGIIRNMVIGGIERLQFEISFLATISVNIWLFNIFTFDSIRCEKILNIREINGT